MERTTIANAARVLGDALHILDDAYWEVSTIAHKDVIYDMIGIIHGEVTELAKLSVQDLYMEYEPITSPFRNALGRLKVLHASLETWVVRSKTAHGLDSELRKLLNLFDRDD